MVPTGFHPAVQRIPQWAAHLSQAGRAMNYQPISSLVSGTAEPVGDPRPFLTVQEAAQATQVSRSTIKRRLADQIFPNAYRAQGDHLHPSGSWLIPVTDLLVVGYRLHAPRSSEPPEWADEPPPKPPELARMRAELVQLHRRAEEAERSAAEW